MSNRVRTFSSSIRAIIISIATIYCLVGASVVIFRFADANVPTYTAGITAEKTTTAPMPAAPQPAFITTPPKAVAVEYPLLGESGSIQVLCSDTGNAMVRVTASTIAASRIKISVTLPNTQPPYTIVLFDSIAPKDGVLHLIEPVPMDRDIVVDLTIDTVADTQDSTASGFSGSKLFRTPYC